MFAERLARPPSPLGWAKGLRPFGPAFRRAASNSRDGPVYRLSILRPDSRAIGGHPRRYSPASEESNVTS